MDDWKPLAEVETVVVGAPRERRPDRAGGTPGAFEPQAPPAYDAPSAAAAPAYQAPAAARLRCSRRLRGARRRAQARGRREARGPRARPLRDQRAARSVQTSAPAVRARDGPRPARDERPDGAAQRELGALLARGPHEERGRAPAAASAPTTANKDDSGLIDLKALAVKAESMRPTAMRRQATCSASPLGLAPPPLGAPVGALGSAPEAQPKSKLPLIIGGGAGVAGAPGARHRHRREDRRLGVRAAGADGHGPSPRATATVEPSATVCGGRGRAFGQRGSVGERRLDGEEARRGRRRLPPGPGRGQAAPAGAAAAAAAPAPTPAPAPKKSGGDCGCNGDLMCLMKCSTH